MLGLMWVSSSPIERGRWPIFIKMCQCQCLSLSVSLDCIPPPCLLGCIYSDNYKRVQRGGIFVVSLARRWHVHHTDGRIITTFIRFCFHLLLHDSVWNASKKRFWYWPSFFTLLVFASIVRRRRDATAWAGGGTVLNIGWELNDKPGSSGIAANPCSAIYDPQQRRRAMFDLISSSSSPMSLAKQLDIAVVTL